MKAKPGFKWVVVLTLPESRKKLVCGGLDGKLALYPVDGGKMFNVLGWDDSKDAHKWVKDLLAGMDTDRRARFNLMRPDLGQIEVVKTEASKNLVVQDCSNN